MALFIVINLFVFDDGDNVHNWIGYGTLLIVLLRGLIGLTSDGYDSFKKFPLHPRELFSFVQNFFNKNRKNYIGHNPIASYMYFVFWFLVLGLGISGVLLVFVDAFFGDEFLEQIHSFYAKAIIVFLLIHFTGIILDSALHRRKTWMSIITGRK